MKLCAEPCRLGGEPDVAGQRDAEASAVGGAVDCRDHGLPKSVYPRGEVRDALLPAHAGPRELGAAARLRRARVGQVQTRAESAPGPGDHHHPAVVIGADAVDRGVQLLDELVVQRVSLSGRFRVITAMSGRG
jgi:hypothetical protein